MKFYRGRLFDHVRLVVANLEASRRFYDAAIGGLGLPIQIVDGPGFFGQKRWSPDCVAATRS